MTSVQEKTMYVEISIYMGTTLGLHNIQDLSRIPQKYHKNYYRLNIQGQALAPRGAHICILYVFLEYPLL